MASTFTYNNPTPTYAPSLAIEPKQMIINADIDVLQMKVNLAVEIMVTCNNTKARTIVLDGIGFSNMNVTGKGISVDWTYDGKKISVTWEDAFQLHEKRTISLVYMVKQPISGIYFSVPDEKYPKRPVFAVTDHETERARYWLACVDHPSVRPTVEIRIKTSKDYSVLATGKNMGHTVKENHQISVWRFNQPCPSYLTCFAVGDFIYVDAQEGLENIPIRYYSVKGMAPQDLGGVFHPTPTLITYLERKLGVPFPFTDKYYQLAIPGVPIGAMENSTLTTWSYAYIYSEADTVDCEIATDMTNLHEIAHSYFGNTVIYKHYDEAWLKEGFAKYMELAWLEDNHSADEHHYRALLFKKEYFAESAEKYARKVVENKYNSSWDLFDRHTYSGAAWRIKQLRHILGDEIFWAAIKDYLTTCVAAPVETSDLRKVFEKHSGLNLAQYFNQWFYTPGYPVVHINYTFNPESKELTLTGTQIQKNTKHSDDDSDNDDDNVVVFAMSIPVVIIDGDKVVEKTLKFESDPRATLIVPLTKKPASIEIDPSGTALFDLKFECDVEKLKYSLTKSKYVLSRIWAAKELLSLNTKQGFDEVELAMKTEKFWGVKAEVSKVLAHIKSSTALKVLLSMLKTEVEAKPTTHALSEVVLYARYFVDATLKHEMQKIIEIPGLPSRVYASALECIGWQGIPDDIPFIISKIEANLQTPSGLEPIVAQGGLRALGLSRTLKGYEYLLDNIEYGKLPDLAREAAIWGLYYSTKWSTKVPKAEGTRKLTELLNDPFYMAKKAAIEALLYLETNISKLKEIKNTLSNQEQVWLTRKLKQIKSTNKQKKSKVTDNTKPYLTKIFKSTTQSWEQLLKEATNYIASNNNFIMHNIIVDNWNFGDVTITVHYGEIPPGAEKFLTKKSESDPLVVTTATTTAMTTTTTTVMTTANTSNTPSSTPLTTSDPGITTAPAPIALPIKPVTANNNDDDDDDDEDNDAVGTGVPTDDKLNLEMKYRKAEVSTLESQLAEQKAALQQLKRQSVIQTEDQQQQFQEQLQQQQQQQQGQKDDDSRKRSAAKGGAPNSRASAWKSVKPSS